MDQWTKFLTDENTGAIERRRVLQMLGLGAGAALTAGLLPRLAHAQANRAFVVTTVNHLSYPCTDYKKAREFYVDFFGMRCTWDDDTKCQVDCGPENAPNSLYLTQAKPGDKPTVAHFAFGLPDFWKLSADLKAEMLRRKLPGVRVDGEAGYFVDGPSGYVNQPVTVKDPAMFPGAANPCEVANSDKCREGYAKGLKNLAAIPKPSGKGFKATAFKYIVLKVPDVAAERDFYTSLFGMKVVADKKDDVSLRFGDNTLVLRSSGGAKVSCNEFGFVVDNFDQAKAKAELDRRGIASKANPLGGLAFNDPNGLEIGIAGRG